MGLIEQPTHIGDSETFICERDEQSIEVIIQRELLSPAHIRKGLMLVNIEGFGRFRLTFENDPVNA